MNPRMVNIRLAIWKRTGSADKVSSTTYDSLWVSNVVPLYQFSLIFHLSNAKMRISVLLLLSVAAGAIAQLSGRVGPTTSREAKAVKKVCNILQYGGVASATTDNSAAITKAWSDCKSGGQVYVPSGSYGLERWVDLSGGKGVSFNLEGVIYRISNGTAGGNMIAVQRTDDFEFYSGNSKGAIQGYGYEFHKRE
jgi:rhamnogalacturonan hydrolase